MIANIATTETINLAQQILDCFDDGVLLVDQDWTITSVTPRCLQMVCSSENWIGKSLWDFLPTNCLHSLETNENLQNSLEQSRSFTFEGFYTHGINCWFRFSVRPRPAGMTVFIRDLTDQHLAAAKHLQDRENAITAVVLILAHEINNPLQALTNLLLLALRECNESSVRELLSLAECQLLRVAVAAGKVFQEHSGAQQTLLSTSPLIGQSVVRGAEEKLTLGDISI